MWNTTGAVLLIVLLLLHVRGACCPGSDETNGRR
jgi:hypothetical protein